MSQGVETIGRRLLAAREARGLTRNQARQEIGYTYPTYLATELGERLPAPVEAAAIALWLGVDVAGLKQEIAAERATRRAQRAATPAAIDPGAPAAEVHAEQPIAGGAA